jgi:hypothetical protein
MTNCFVLHSSLNATKNSAISQNFNSSNRKVENCIIAISLEADDEDYNCWKGIFFNRKEQGEKMIFKSTGSIAYSK